MSRALALKLEGNRHFQNGDYTTADRLYSQAITADPKNSSLYTNRAMAHLRLGNLDSAITDCQTCLALSPSSMKANYYLGQAYFSKGNFDEALSHAQTAHTLCVATNDKSLSLATTLILKCKRGQWKQKAQVRRSEDRLLKTKMMTLLLKERDDRLSAEVNEVSKTVIRAESDAMIERLNKTFERADGGTLKMEVPRWAIDDITYEIMVDPVITPCGKSYERAAIMEHIRRHPIDPLTKERLQVSDLRPNLALKEACEEFSEANGWTVDC